MGKDTKIQWTDDTHNHWWGCTKVSEACPHCYAEGVGKRKNVHWGAGAPRLRMAESTRSNADVWNRTAVKSGKPRRVFAENMGDLFDNEVPDAWRDEFLAQIERCSALHWQLLTKRIGNVARMVPAHWCAQWPQHAGLMITVIDQPEADRDVPKLVKLKTAYAIPWIGISYEPALGPIDFRSWLGPGGLDWIIFGGESGPGWRPVDLDWARAVRDQCAAAGVAFFMKQIAGFRPRDTQIPADLFLRAWPSLSLVDQRKSAPTLTVHSADTL